MVEVPEKIWVNPHDFETNSVGKVEYLRADIAGSQIAELRDHSDAMEVEHRRAIEEMQSALADKARLSEALEKSRKNVVAVMKALMATGSRDNLLLADAVHKADDAARAALASLEDKT